MTGADLVQAARGWLGTPWVHAQRQRGIACDCVGLFLGIAHELGLTDYEPANYSLHVDPEFLKGEIQRFCEPVAGDPLAGDLVLLAPRLGQPATHVGMATGEGTLIHANQDVGKVIEQTYGPAMKRLVAGVYRWRGL